MKVLLIMADANMHKFWIFGRLKSAREAPLTLTTLAAIGGEVPDVEFRLVDESVDMVPLDYPADLVGISVLTGTARRAYALANHFRSRGIPVVLGGAHVTILPQEAARYADAIVVGMAEQTWPQVLRDFLAGKMARVYRAEPELGVIPLKKKWGGLATTKITSDPELFDLLVRSGCGFLLIGFESISQRSLNKIHKGFNARESYDESGRIVRGVSLGLPRDVPLEENPAPRGLQRPTIPDHAGGQHHLSQFRPADPHRERV